MLKWLKSRALRLWTADSAALLAYNIPAGAINCCLEWLLIGSTLHQWMLIHWAIFTPVKYGLAFIEANFKKRLRWKFRARKGTMRRRLVDSLALACYQMPLYLAASWVGGRSVRQLAILFCLSAAEHAIFGPYHGWILDWCEAKFANGRRQRPINVATKAASD